MKRVSIMKTGARRNQQCHLLKEQFYTSTKKLKIKYAAFFFFFLLKYAVVQCTAGLTINLKKNWFQNTNNSLKFPMTINAKFPMTINSFSVASRFSDPTTSCRSSGSNSGSVPRVAVDEPPHSVEGSRSGNRCRPSDCKQLDWDSFCPNSGRKRTPAGREGTRTSRRNVLRTGSRRTAQVGGAIS